MLWRSLRRLGRVSVWDFAMKFVLGKQQHYSSILILKDHEMLLLRFLTVIIPSKNGSCGYLVGDDDLQFKLSKR